MSTEKEKHKIKYFVDDVPYETDQPTMTGAMITAKIPSFDPTYALILEGKGKDPDQQILPDTSVAMEREHGGPLRFFTVPPATFGK
jgi:hypothetical protein